MSKMRPLILTLLLIGAVYGKPGLLESPAPTPSAAPAVIANLAPPTPSVSSFQTAANAEVSVGGPVVNIGGQSQGAGLPTYGTGFNFGLSQPGLGLAQPGLGLGLTQPGISYGPPGLSLSQPGLSYIQPGLNFQSGIGFGQPPLNLFSLGAGLNSAPLNLSPIGPTISPIIGSTIGPNLDSGLAPNIGPTLGPSFASTIGPTIAPAVSSTLAPIGSSAGSVELAAAPVNVNIGSSSGASAASLIHKHVYVYVAPEQPEEIIPRRPIEVPPAQTHYKIIFIKAPAPPKPTAPVIPPLPQDEEKTIVYVLAKRPEEAPEIKLQTPPPTQPAKPEVYFIRYNARKEETVHKPEIDIDVRGGPSPVTVSPVGLGGIAQDLNTASLSGGSALSNAINSSPQPNIVQISTTPIPKYGPPSYDQK